MLIRIPQGWESSENEVTSEERFLNRRKFLKGLAAFGTLSYLGIPQIACSQSGPKIPNVPIGPPKGLTPLAKYPLPRNRNFTVERALTDERIAAAYNNFYEFTTDKGGVWRLVDKFNVRPWAIEIAGLVEKPFTIDIAELVKKMPLEERVQRFRCVEAWSMVVPWSGFPLKELVKLAKPLSKAKFVRFVSFHRPKEAPGQKTQPWYPWPYYEALTLAEATNELAFMATGIYGHDLPKQHGAPVRLVLPWKYGFKSIKSIVRIEFTDKRPPTFWNDTAPKEYFFEANIEPQVPHPRWSQATERDIGTGKRIKTQIYNGYGQWVAGLYQSPKTR